MKPIKYLGAALALALLCPAIRAQEDQPSPPAPRREKITSTAPQTLPREAVQKLERTIAALEQKEADKTITEGEARELQRARSMKNLVQLQRKQASGQELTEAEARQLRELKAKLGEQRPPAQKEPKIAALGNKVVDKSQPDAAERQAQRQRAMQALEQLQRKQASGQELTEAEARQLSALKSKFAEPRQPTEPKLKEPPKRPEGKSPEGQLKSPPRGPEPGDAARPLAGMRQMQAQREARLKAMAEARQRGHDLQLRLREARRQLQAAANEPKLNEEAIRERANQIGKLEGELAILRARMLQGLKANMAPAQNRQFGAAMQQRAMAQRWAQSNWNRPNPMPPNAPGYYGQPYGMPQPQYGPNNRPGFGPQGPAWGGQPNPGPNWGPQGWAPRPTPPYGPQARAGQGWQGWQP